MKIAISGKKSRDDSFNCLAAFGRTNNQFMDKLCAVLLAISPVLKNYKGPVNNAGTTVLLIAAVYIAMKLLVRRQVSFREIAPVMWILVFTVYKIVAHGTTFEEFAVQIVLIVIYIGAASGCVNIRFFVKTGAYVSVLASVLIIIQYICYYVLGFHLKLAPTSLLLDSAEQWIGGVNTGLIGINGVRGNLYRPSAFFLEPAHLFLYIFPILMLLLLAPNSSVWKRRMAMLLSLGMVLSTSGMGIAVTVCVWGLYLGVGSKNNRLRMRNLLKVRNITWIFVLLGLFVAGYIFVPFLRQSVNRILFANDRGSTAISGRTAAGFLLVRSISGSGLLFGVQESVADIEYHLTGFVSTMYRYGAIGILLSYAFYIQGFFRLKQRHFWINFVVMALSFFSAHTHAIYMGLYYAFILLDGYKDADAIRYFQQKAAKKKKKK